MQQTAEQNDQNLKKCKQLKTIFQIIWKPKNTIKNI